LDYKAPKDVRGIKSFIGMAGYYRCFIEGFSKIVRPMAALLAKKVEFKWTLACLKSFETLKEKLTTAPVLILLDVHKPFSVYCDASYTGRGCVLMQEGRVVAYSSRLSAFRPRGSLDRRVNCRCVSPPRWVGARRNTRGKTVRGNCGLMLSCA
jgi:hypothetical protein